MSLTEPPGLPAKPSGFRVRAGDGQVTLSWAGPRAAISKFQYQQFHGGGWSPWNNIPESRQGGKHRTSYTVPSLNNGTAYSFRLRAVSHIGAGPASDVLGPVTPAAAPLPAHIDGLRAVPATDDVQRDRHAVLERPRRRQHHQVSAQLPASGPVE